MKRPPQSPTLNVVDLRPKRTVACHNERLYHQVRRTGRRRRRARLANSPTLRAARWTEGCVAWQPASGLDHGDAMHLFTPDGLQRGPTRLYSMGRTPTADFGTPRILLRSRPPPPGSEVQIIGYKKGTWRPGSGDVSNQPMPLYDISEDVWYLTRRGGWTGPPRTELTPKTGHRV